MVTKDEAGGRAGPKVGVLWAFVLLAAVGCGESEREPQAGQPEQIEAFREMREAGELSQEQYEAMVGRVEGASEGAPRDMPVPLYADARIVGARLLPADPTEGDEGHEVVFTVDARFGDVVSFYRDRFADIGQVPSEIDMGSTLVLSRGVGARPLLSVNISDEEEDGTSVVITYRKR